ncbi:unnamed protein product [Ilex paraguariensis]|uniref:K Homology domain-containing protein n=1 Tax=Ilex paraguariensis TaxID=185542 RepID=A0ABC8TE31_9AQUA
MISGKPALAKLALYEVSTLLHQNPRKDKPPLNFKMAHGGQSFQPAAPAMRNMLPPGNPMWPERYSDPHGMLPVPWMGGYGNQPSGFGQGGFNDAHAACGGESPSEFSMKILCSATKIGGVIGKGGFNVKQLQKETGAGIHVEDVLAESDDRVIRISSFEALWDPRSQTIEAILQLQHKTSEQADDGIITTRLLVPSSKVGCILGQGGHVINEMRRRTRADIRVYSKEDKPKCASEDEELVQISGNFGVAKDTLAEIASRLRTRCLRDANAGAEPAPVEPVPRLGPSRSLPGARPPPSGPIGAGSSGRYEILKGGGREYEPPSYLVPPSATGFQNISHFMELRIPNNAVNSGMVSGRNNIGEIFSSSFFTNTDPTPNSDISYISILYWGRNANGIWLRQIAGTRVKLQDHQSGGSEGGVEIRGSSEHLNTSQNILQTYANTGGENNNPQQGSYQNYNAEQGAYANINATQTSYQINPQQTSFQINPQQTPYQTFNSQQAAYQNISAQRYYKY